VVVTELPDAEAPPPAPAPEVTPPPPPAPAPAAKGKVKKRPLPRKPKVKRPEEKKGLGAGEVQGRFRAARREYAGFKERYGARLEAEWNELADRATYAKTPEQLADLDRKIRQFRARMTAESKGRPAEDPKGTPKRPSDGPLEPAIP